jgi:hypothetical protein
VLSLLVVPVVFTYMDDLENLIRKLRGMPHKPKSKPKGELA